MQSKRSFYILLGVTVVMVAAAVLSQRPAEEYTASHGLYAPALGERADEVRTIVIRSAGGELRLERIDDGWVAGNKDGYPADAGRVRALVLGLSRLERLEKKTADPARLARLELNDVDEPGSRAVEVTLLNGHGAELASVLVGKTQDFQSAGDSRYFVRDAGDPQSWLVQGTLPPVLEDAGSWLQDELLPGVEAAGLRSVSVTHPGGETVAVRRGAGDQEEFVLTDLSGGETMDSQFSVNQLANTLARLSLKDVRAAGEAQAGDPVLSVEAMTFNGVRITARFEQREPDYGVTLSAAYEPDQDRGGDSGSEQTANGARESAGNSEAPSDDEDRGDGGNEQDTDESGAGDVISGSELARKLNQRWDGRLFIVSQYALDALMVQRADLVKTAEKSGEG